MSSPGAHRPVAELEQALGLSFRDRGLLIQALTHRSYVNETGGSATDSYERLEFLGDVVARLIVSEELYRRLPECDEGGLTRRWTALLSQRALAAAARDLGLAGYVLLGRGFEESGGRYGDAVLGDVMESVIAAVYLDQGSDSAREFVLRALAGPVEAACQPGWRPDNPKAELQELLQGQASPLPCTAWWRRPVPHINPVSMSRLPRANKFSGPEPAPARAPRRSPPLAPPWPRLRPAD